MQPSTSHNTDTPRVPTLNTQPSLAAHPPIYHRRPLGLGDLLAAQPQELFLMVLSRLLDTTEHTPQGSARDEFKSGLSRASLVCREWCRILRPKLIEDLELRSPADVRFLLNALRRPSEGWSSTAIKQLTVVSATEKLISIPRSCHLLAGKLPSLRRLSIYADDATFGPSMQPFFARHKDIRYLKMTGVEFYSMSTLVHVLGGMENLEELDLPHCFLLRAEDRPPTRMSVSSFRKLRCVRYFGYVGPGTCWLFAPLLARRCEGLSDDATTDNSDAKLLILLHTSLADEDCEGGRSLMEYDEDTGAIKIELRPSVMTIPDRPYVRIVTLWPTTSVSANGKWSVIRRIECFDERDATFRYTRWKSLDRALARDATRLEKLVFRSNYDAQRLQLPTHLPRLTARNKFEAERRPTTEDEDEYDHYL